MALRSRIACLSLAVALAAGATVAYGDVAFSDFPANYAYDVSEGYVMSGTSSGVGGEYGTAVTFDSQASGTLLDMIMPVEGISGTGSIDVSLCSDAGGSIGNVIESWMVAPDGPFGENNPMSFLVGDGSATLTQGAVYWITALPGDPGGSLLATWELNAVNEYGATANFASGSWQNLTNPLPAVEVDVIAAPAPEPVSLGLLAAGAGALLRRRVR